MRAGPSSRSTSGEIRSSSSRLFICGGPEMAPALPQAADNPDSELASAFPQAAGSPDPDLLPALPQAAGNPEPDLAPAIPQAAGYRVTNARILTRKLIESHLVAGKPVAGEEIGLRVDQALLTDTNGTMAFLRFEAMGFPRVRPPRVVTYIDHNVYQVDSRNSDDHRYLQTAARRYGSWFSKPGNGICHQVHFESFSAPSQTLLGADSLAPLCGSTGMLAIGAGGLDVAVAMGGGPYHLVMPRVTSVWLSGRLPPWVSAKDVILELLRRYSVRGGSGRIFEYGGPGAATLSLPQRATICNMGAELTLTTSV